MYKPLNGFNSFLPGREEDLFVEKIYLLRGSDSTDRSINALTDSSARFSK